jgi:hypothetical protein
MVRCKCCGSVVGVVTAYGLDDRGVRVRVPVAHIIQSGSGVHSTSQPLKQWVQEVISPGVKQQGREADH